jgi:hypothetical protein
MNRDSISGIVSEWQEIRTKVQTGLILIDTILNNFSGNFLTFEDSMEVFRAPLNINENVSSYQIIFGSSSHLLELAHENEELVNTQSNVIVMISDIEILQHSFDSVNISCQTPECNGNEVTVRCFF